MTTSFSALKSFETCPRKHYEEKVLKLYPFQETDATRYGILVHKMAEDYVRDGTPLPENLKQLERALAVLRNMPGEKHAELEMGITEDLEPCEFSDERAWLRGIVDLLIVDGSKGWVVDYKTGSSRYPDKDQLLLMSLMAAAKYPELEQFKAALVFLKDRTLVKAQYSREDVLKSKDYWAQRVDRLDNAHRIGYWPERPNGLCKAYCPVANCAHNGGYHGKS